VTGNVQLHINPAVRPGNDDLTSGFVLTGRNETVTATNFDTTTDLNEGLFQNMLGLFCASWHMIWWEWIAPFDGAADITTTNSFEIARPERASATSIVVFEGDTFPASRDGVIFDDDSTYVLPGAVTLNDVREGHHYRIGVDCVDWNRPTQFVLRIRGFAPPRILPATIRIEGGLFRGTVDGTIGKNYRVKSSTDLKTWDFVKDFPAIEGQFTFENAVGPAYRFYRIEEY
jgi:hypothetical protein